MKVAKGFIALFFLSLYCFGLVIHADTHSTLPGGKNYIDQDNFDFTIDHMGTINMILVKPNQMYTLTIPRQYYEMGGESLLTFYQDETYLYDWSIEMHEFIVYQHDNFYYVTFFTPVNGDFLQMRFMEPDNYFYSLGMVGFQLEEGPLFTGYEAYLPGTIYDVNGPVFTGDAIILSNVDSPITTADILASFSAYDAIDGDVTSSIVVIHNDYVGYEGVLGDYDVTFQASDTAGNSTIFTFTIRVLDVTSPVWSDLDLIEISFPLTYTISEIIAMLHASDNYDGDLSDDIGLVSENYLLNSSFIGSYQLQFSVTDSSGNVSFHMVELRVNDHQKPVFTGPATMSIGYTHVITEQELLALYSVMDNYDGNLSTSITIKTDAYRLNRTKIGEYEVVLTVSDSSGNTTEKVITISVVDLIGPLLYFDTAIIKIYNDTFLSLVDITNLLIKTKELDNQVYRVTVHFDTYSKHASTPGVYHMSLSFQNDKEESITKKLQFIVALKPSSIIDILPDNLPPNSDTFFQQYWSFISTAGLGIGFVVTNLIWWKSRPKK